MRSTQKALPRWGYGGKIIGDASPKAVLELLLSGRPVSRLELFERAVQVGQDRVKAGCIGGVWTDPLYRRQGHAASLIRQACSLLHREGADIALLFSLEPMVPYYQGLDFERLTGVVTMRQPWAVATASSTEQVLVPPGVAALVCGLAYTVVDADEPVDIVGLPW